MNRLTTLTCVSSICLFASLVRAQREDVPDRVPPRTITTSGEAVVYVVPDEIVINFGVETFDPELRRAKEANDEASKKLLDAIRKLGVEDKHLQTSDLDVELDYKDNGHASKGIEGYFARRMYSMTLKDTKKFEQAIDTALANGANRLMGFEYRTTQLRKHRDEARRMAIRAAREKADALARELECTVGKPRTIGEGYYGSVGSWGARWGWGGGMNSYNVAQNVAQADGGGGAGNESGEALPLGQVGVRAQITVTFDLAG
jgi:uncharacterized protein YggE